VAEVLEMLQRAAVTAAANVDITVLDFKPAVETVADHPFVTACVTACFAVRNATPTIAGVSYYSDATILAPAFNLPFAIIGPGELGMSGRPDESVEVARVHEAVTLYHRIVADWMGV